MEALNQKQETRYQFDTSKLVPGMVCYYNQEIKERKMVVKYVKQVRGGYFYFKGIYNDKAYYFTAYEVKNYLHI